MYAIMSGSEYPVKDSDYPNYFSNSPIGLRIFDSEQSARTYLALLNVYTELSDALGRAVVVELSPSPLVA